MLSNFLEINLQFTYRKVVIFFLICASSYQKINFHKIAVFPMFLAKAFTSGAVILSKQCENSGEGFEFGFGDGDFG